MHQLTGIRRTLLATAVAVTVGAVGIGTSYAIDGGSRASSHFKKSGEGWTVTGDPVKPKPKFLKKGGNPGGFIRTTDSATGGIMYWEAPAKFLGNKGADYGGLIGFDLRLQSAGRFFDASDVILKGGGVRLTYNTATDPGATWTRYKVPLTEAGWQRGGLPASRADMLAVLASLKTVLIRAEYTSHNDTGDLDNVYIKPPKSTP